METVTANYIIKQVADFYGVTPSDILSNKRHRIFADCRTVICYVLCVGLGLPAIRVGVLLNRTHVTVLYHIAKGKDWLRMPMLNNRGAAVIGYMMAMLRQKSA
jgi:chromosomal replication initiation ATPase DnaA